MKASLLDPSFPISSPSISSIRPTTRVMRPADAATALDEISKIVFEDFRRVRSEMAKEHDLPAYFICRDKTLALLATERRQTPESMERVKGFGPHTARLYGDRFLEVLGGSAAA